MTAVVTRRAALAAALAFALSSVAGGAGAQDPAATEAARAARDWLALADALDAETSLREAGAKYRAALTPERWREALAIVREPLGAVVQRTLAGSQAVSRLQGLPDGDYAQVMYRTSWTNKSIGREYVTLERESGRWRVIGYVVQ
ncbi:MAG: DUF4019 domain-containing protein [Burkholderiales bacterium]